MVGPFWSCGASRRVSARSGPWPESTSSCHAGEVTALCGDNGAGKSVTIKIIAGIHPADGGQILWRGRPVSIRTPKDSAALGIATVYQDLALCDNLDIVQNMFLGREPTKFGCPGRSAHGIGGPQDSC